MKETSMCCDMLSTHGLIRNRRIVASIVRPRVRKCWTCLSVFCDVMLLLFSLKVQEIKSMIQIRVHRPIVKFDSSYTIPTYRCGNWNDANAIRTMATNSDSSEDSGMDWTQQDVNYNDDPAPRRSRLADRIRRLDIAMQKNSVDYLTSIPIDSADTGSRIDDNLYFQSKFGIFQIKSAEQHS